MHHVITGATSGIGQVVARALLGRGDELAPAAHAEGRLMRTATVGVRRVAIVAAAAFGLTMAPAVAAPTMPKAQVVTSVWATGALFFHSPGQQPDVDGRHICSASVIRSSLKDLVVTAAHCIHGRHKIFDFVPDFHDGHAPHGVWTVQAVYLPYRWKHGWSQKADFAILRVNRHHGRSVQAMVGSRPIGSAHAGSRTRVVGYPSGTGGRPITCSNQLYRTAGYPSFDCRGYVGGVSGGPFIQNGSLVGVIGGLHYGGCNDHTSYAAPFGSRLKSLLGRAENGGPGDQVPATIPAEGC